VLSRMMMDDETELEVKSGYLRVEFEDQQSMKRTYKVP